MKIRYCLQYSLLVSLSLAPFRTNRYPETSQFRPCQLLMMTPESSYPGVEARSRNRVEAQSGVPRNTWTEPLKNFPVVDKKCLEHTKFEKHAKNSRWQT